jgi:integrase
MTDAPKKITFGEMREMGVRGILVYWADCTCSHSIPVSADQWPEDLRLSTYLDTATIDIRRAKNGTPGLHGLQGYELRLLRALRREHPHAEFVFLSERKAPLSVDGAQKLIERLGEAAKLPFPIHAHMLRHAAGYALAARGRSCRRSWAIARLRTQLSTPQ